MMSPKDDVTWVRRIGRALGAVALAAASAALALLLHDLTHLVRDLDALVTHVDQTTLPAIDDSALTASTYFRTSAADLGPRQDRILAGAEHVVESANTTVSTFNAQVLPPLAEAARNTAETTARFPPLIDRTTQSVGDMSESVDDLLKEAQGLIADSRHYEFDNESAIHAVLLDLAKTSDNITVISDPEIWKRMGTNGADTLGELRGITSDGHRVTTYLADKLAPRPRTYPKNLLLRTLKRVGYYSLDVLKEGSNALVLLQYVK